MFGKQGHSASVAMLPRGHFACSVGSGSKSTSVWLVGNRTNDSDEKIVTGAVVNHTHKREFREVALSPPLQTFRFRNGGGNTAH